MTKKQHSALIEKKVNPIMEQLARTGIGPTVCIICLPDDRLLRFSIGMRSPLNNIAMLSEVADYLKEMIRGGPEIDKNEEPIIKEGLS